MSYPMPATYRYTLTRDLANPGLEPRICWVMLNPSTADEALDDPTIRRVKRFSEDHGFSKLVVVNLFAVRSTDPRDLEMFEDPIGPDNEQAIVNEFSCSSEVVFAWGASGIPCMKRKPIQFVTVAALRLGVRPKCLGKTKDGSPRHPLYVSAATRLEPFL